ncbi:MAG: hypothetical protein LBS67_00955, partial [Clostridiales Family XIII bacterium]|nr:hypothetical protein [Clostridiales Family XIII bacterium]
MSHIGGVGAGRGSKSGVALLGFKVFVLFLAFAMVATVAIPTLVLGSSSRGGGEQNTPTFTVLTDAEQSGDASPSNETIPDDSNTPVIPDDNEDVIPDDEADPKSPDDENSENNAGNGDDTNDSTDDTSVIPGDREAANPESPDTDT